MSRRRKTPRQVDPVADCPACLGGSHDAHFVDWQRLHNQPAPRARCRCVGDCSARNLARAHHLANSIATMFSARGAAA